MIGYIATAAASAAIGALLVAVQRTKREQAIVDAYRPNCPVCRDTGAVVTNERRPRALFCNLCHFGAELQGMSTARVDWASVTAIHDLPSGDAA